MPRFVAAVDVAAPLARVFDFFRNPANLVGVAPPALQLQLEDAPQEIRFGSRITLASRRWGLRYRSVTEVIAFEPPVAFVDEQKEGAFRQWVHTHRFEDLAGDGTRVVDQIDYEPPGGLLGLVLTPATVESELAAFFRYRNAKLAELVDSIRRRGGKE
jgi:ligand-binding SRPBCC domain-containing protein